MKLIAALVWAFVMGALTLLVGPLSLVSDQPAYAALIHVLYVLVVPGLVLGTIVGSPGMAMGINFVLHACVCWLVFRVVEGLRKGDEAEEDGADSVG